MNNGRVKSSSDLFLISVLLRGCDSKPPSSNCANVIISPVWSFKDLSYGMYETTGCIDIPSEYGCDVYAKALETISSKSTLYEDTILPLWGT